MGKRKKADKKKVEMNQWLTVTACRERRQRGERKKKRRRKEEQTEADSEEGKQRNGVNNEGNKEGLEGGCNLLPGI